jgi:hypothetical protein
MKRQKSIKLNLNDAANTKGNIGMRKSSEIIQDTFRGGESQERITQQVAAGHVQSLPPTAAQDPAAADAAPEDLGQVDAIVNRVPAAPDGAGSVATVDRNGQ